MQAQQTHGMQSSEPFHSRTPNVLLTKCQQNQSQKMWPHTSCKLRMEAHLDPTEFIHQPRFRHPHTQGQPLRTDCNQGRLQNGQPQRCWVIRDTEFTSTLPHANLGSSLQFWFSYDEHRILEGNQLKLKQQLAYSVTKTSTFHTTTNRSFSKVST